MREPAQVFTLLETLFKAYDKNAKRLGIFKVETVGECYVAACGVPNPRPDHAVQMARFAVRCVQTMHQVTKDLELSLGPDTTDLKVRIGIHSGPVTAGVLRGERARFQLFGDTMNVAARIETTGAAGRIHVSKETASLLQSAGKASWVVPREGTVVAKGKGEMNTFWLAYHAPRTTSSPPQVTNGAASVVSDLHSRMSTRDQAANVKFGVQVEDFMAPEERRKRLVEYNKEILLRLLKHVVAARRAKHPDGISQEEELVFDQFDHPAEEVAEVIEIPYEENVKEASDEVSSTVEEQLELYISDIAGMYRNNPFHSFEVST